jgi:ornithine carbamoyltransferase
MASWTTTTRWATDLVRIGDLTAPGLDELLDLADRMKAEHERWVESFPGASLTCLYETPSTRAGLSAEAAAHRLGMAPIRVAPSELRLGRGEPLEDAMRIMSHYTRAIAARDLDEDTLEAIARAADVPVINLQSPRHHPCQAVADLVTLRARHDTLGGVVLAYVGPSTNAAVSLMQAGAMAGMQVRLACPPDHRPEPEDLTAAELLADLHGGKVSVGADPKEAVAGADAVYAAPWPETAGEAERRRLATKLRPFQVNSPIMALAKPTAVFMHCLPAHRGEEVTDGVIDGRHSVVWEQAGNRLPAEQAVIYALVAAAGTER